MRWRRRIRVIDDCFSIERMEGKKDLRENEEEKKQGGGVRGESGGGGGKGQKTREE